MRTLTAMLRGPSWLAEHLTVVSDDGGDAALTGRDLIWAGFLGLLTLGVYSRCLGVGFFSDDYIWLGRMVPTLERPLFVFSVFFRDFNPVLHASFVLDWLLGGGSAIPYHLSSLLVHAAAASLLVLLLRRSGAELWLAVAAASVWALNVRLSEAVIWPAARGHSLAALLVLLALVLISTRRRVVLAAGLLALALLSKETAFFVLPFAVFFTPLQRRRQLQIVGAVAALACAFVLLNLLAKPSLHMSPAGLTELAVKAPFILLRPLGLGDDYPFTPLAAFVVYLTVLVLAVACVRRPQVLLGLAWVVTTSIPVVLLPKLSSRYLYLPALGYALVLVGLTHAVADLLASRSARRWMAGLAGTLVLLLLGGNGVLIQREITDYTLLSRPYARLVELMRGPIAALEVGETLLVYDLSPRATQTKQTELVLWRGGIMKLIPQYRYGLGGLIRIVALVNYLKEPAPGVLAFAAPSAPPGVTRYLQYDGSKVRELEGPMVEDLPPERVLAATWGDAEHYFAMDHH